MKLRVDRITEEVGHCAFADPPQEVNARLSHGEVRDFRLLGPLSIETDYYRAGEDLYFSGRVHGELEGTCARCLEPFALTLDQAVQLVLVPEPAAPAERELAAEDVALSFYSGEEVDLAPLFAEQVILALPTRALCREDCRGLCSGCGVNLNRETCGCGAPAPDPRLAVLRQLRVERSS